MPRGADGTEAAERRVRKKNSEYPADRRHRLAVWSHYIALMHDKFISK